MKRIVLVLFALHLASCGDQVVVREIEASCGNGSVELGEACDDGNLVNGDACTNSCSMAICGDEITRSDRILGDVDFEACDDGNTDDTDGCLSNCVAARCGDGVLRLDRSEGQEGFERCDDANEINDDACLNNCVDAVCGDGHLGSPIRSIRDWYSGPCHLDAAPRCDRPRHLLRLLLRDRPDLH